MSLDIFNTHPRIWTNARLHAEEHRIRIVSDAAEESSLERVREVFERCRDLLIKDLDQQDPKTRMKLTFCCNQNIAQLNERIKAYNAAKTAEKITKLDLIPLPGIVFHKKEGLESVVTKKQFDPKLVPPSYAPDTDCLNEWVKAQHPVIQPVAFALAQGVADHYVSFPEFIQALDETTAKVERRIENRSFGLVLVDGEEKSGLWVSRLARFNRPPNTQRTAFSFSKMAIMGYTGILSDEEKKIRDWVVVDDASYSANQMKGEILRYVIPGLIKNIPEGEIRIHLAVPYMTPYAVDYLENKLLEELGEEDSQVEANSYRIKIFLGNSRELMPIGKIFEGIGDPEDRTIAKRLSEVISSMKENSYSKNCQQKLSVNYFDHKVGDELSFPAYLSEGKVVNYSYRSNYLSLKEEVPSPIPQFNPVYKDDD